MKRVIIIGDLHGKYKMPYRKAINTFLKWIVKLYKNDTVLFLGDIFDSSSNHNTIEEEVISYLTQIKEVILLSGNHDYSKRMGNALSPLRHHKNITVITTITELNIMGFNCLFLPFLYTLKENYEQKIKEQAIKQNKFDFVFTHITPQECAFRDEGFELPFVNTTYIHGHTHIQSRFLDSNKNEHIIVGVPQPTRHLEEKQEHKILELDENKKIEFVSVPQSFTYETLQYGDTPKSEDNILNIQNAPSIPSVFEKYLKNYIRSEGITLIKEEGEESIDFDFEADSIKSHFIDFCEEKNIEKSVIDISLEYL